MTGWLARYRTSRGFGVHSPLAFRFITESLRDDKSAYYCWDRITSRAMRRLIRVMSAVNPERLLLFGEPRDPQQRIVLDSPVIHGGRGLMIIVNDAAYLTAAISALQTDETVSIAVYDMRVWDALMHEAGCHASGFTDGKEGFILRRGSLIGKTYLLNFR